jgi:hypothetical protein
MSNLTLAKKVYNLVTADMCCGDGPLERAHEKVPDKKFEEHHADLVDWGMAYGVAYALARIEEPLESTRAAALRAQEAAWQAWVVYGHGFNCNPTKPTEADRQAVGVTAA